jgi:hypothetical protein
LFLNKSFTKGLGGNLPRQNSSQRSLSVNKGRQGNNNRSNSAVRSSHNGSVNSARGGRQNQQVDYYANVDRLRSVNKLTTLDSASNYQQQRQGNFKSLSPKVGIPGGISHMG